MLPNNWIMLTLGSHWHLSHIAKWTIYIMLLFIILTHTILKTRSLKIYRFAVQASSMWMRVMSEIRCWEDPIRDFFPHFWASVKVISHLFASLLLPEKSGFHLQFLIKCLSVKEETKQIANSELSQTTLY